MKNVDFLPAGFLALELHRRRRRKYIIYLGLLAAVLSGAHLANTYRLRIAQAGDFGPRTTADPPWDSWVGQMRQSIRKQNLQLVKICRGDLGGMAPCGAWPVELRVRGSWEGILALVRDIRAMAGRVNLERLQIRGAAGGPKQAEAEMNLRWFYQGS